MSSSCANTGGGGTHTVQRGDYLALISQKTVASVSDLIRLNSDLSAG
jgi:LysM repeat protein